MAVEEVEADVVDICVFNAALMCFGVRGMMGESAAGVDDDADAPAALAFLAAAAVFRVMPFFFIASLDFSVHALGQSGVKCPTSLQL